VTQWLKAQSLDHQPRVAQQLRVDRVLGEGGGDRPGFPISRRCASMVLDGVAGRARQLRRQAILAMVTINAEAAGSPDAASLQAKVQGAAVLGSVLVVGIHRGYVGRSAGTTAAD